MLSLTEPACADVDRAGGKGASLARLAALGLPVPPGFVVPAGRLVASLPDGGAELRAALPDPGRAQAAVARAAPPAEIAAAYEELGDDVPVAVRSSACAEDSEAASYAGQQETFLYVRGAGAVRERVRDCWASFFSERALFYRQRHGSLDDLGMAVVVQRMVRADVAGVLFTCNPVQGRRDRMVVEAVLGLGEAAVSGQVTPDHYVIKRDGTLKRSRVATQPFEIVPAPDASGTVQSQLEPEAGGAQKLGDEQLRELAGVGDELERRLGGPQDIEWAYEDGRLYVLQARPVTA
ncbi:MAG TPA: PEP/pyruvate-binding domain-containing protein [Solirubrobacterales bacterium]|nr:PEP/pyruvate-binding domain-containing protein [Solirubrobacterales bacterium]